MAGAVELSEANATPVSTHGRPATCIAGRPREAKLIAFGSK